MKRGNGESHSYSIASLAHRWDVSPRTIHRWIAEGRIPRPDIGFSERTKRFSGSRVEQIEKQYRLGAA
jgi:DNA-binding transcriptional MerR regulator